VGPPIEHGMGATGHHPAKCGSQTSGMLPSKRHIVFAANPAVRLPFDG
jgi:hypothetical protein